MQLRSVLAAAVSATALMGLAACQQSQEETPAAQGDGAADVTVNPPPNVTVNPPDVNVEAPRVPDVNVNPPNINVNPPSGQEKSSTESTTVTVPGVGSTTTTTTEKR